MNCALLCTLLLSAQLDRDSASAEVKAYLDAADRELDSRKAAMAETIKELMNQAKKMHSTNVVELNPAAAKKNRSTQIKLLKEKIKALDTGHVFCAPRLDRDNLVVGQLGRAEFQRSPIESPHRWSGKILQILDGENLLFEHAGKTFWICGKKTANVGDGETVEMTGSFVVEASRTYTTVVGGSKTVQVLKVFSEAEVLPYLPAAQQASFLAEPGDEIIEGLKGASGKKGGRENAKK